MAIRGAILVLVAVLAAEPLCANSVTFAKQSEAHAALFAIRDRVRSLYEKNGNRIDPTWSIKQHFTETELNGSYFELKDFSLTFPKDSPDSVRIECANAYRHRKGPMVLITNLRTREDTLIEPPIDEGQDVPKILFIALFFTLFVGVPVLAIRFFSLRPGLTFGERAGFSLASLGIWLFFCGVFFTFFSWSLERFWESPPVIVALVSSIGGLLGLPLAVFGGLAVHPRGLASALFHVMSALLTGLVVGVMSLGADAGQLAALVVGVCFGALVLGSSIVRYKLGQ